MSRASRGARRTGKPTCPVAGAHPFCFLCPFCRRAPTQIPSPSNLANLHCIPSDQGHMVDPLRSSPCLSFGPQHVRIPSEILACQSSERNGNRALKFSSKLQRILQAELRPSDSEATAPNNTHTGDVASPTYLGSAFQKLRCVWIAHTLFSRHTLFSKARLELKECVCPPPERPSKNTGFPFCVIWARGRIHPCLEGSAFLLLLLNGSVNLYLH